MIAFAGHLRLRARQTEYGRTALVEQSFRAPFHVSKPYWDADTRTLLVQVVNPTAGILAGDRLESDVAVGPEAAVLVTTPSASRVFTMQAGGARCDQRFRVEAGGWLEFLPEPLVPHRGSRYRQSTQIEVEAGGGLFFVDQLQPGRLGHGEAWAWEELQVELSVRHAGTLVLQERLAHTGPELRAVAGFMGSGPTACFANAVLFAPAGVDAARWPAELQMLHQPGTWFGMAALRGGGWSLRIVAADPLRLRDAIRTIRSRLGAHLPGLRCELRRG